MPANTITFQDLADVATELGEQAGKGKDTQIKFLLKMVEGGYHNALDLAQNKHGHGVDDAQKITELYVKAQQGSVVFDAKANNQRVQCSKVRKCIQLGGWPKGGNGEPIATVNNLMTIRQNLRKIPAEVKKLDDAANTLLKYARAQLKRDSLIPEAELKTFCYKPGKQLDTVEDILNGMVKKLDKLIDGKLASGTAQCNTPNAKNARQALRQELTDIAKARGKALGPNPTPKLQIAV